MVPKGASLSQSVVNLKLIKRKAEELNKEISIVTGDKVARTLAEKVGISAASSVHGLAAVPVLEEAETKEADPLLATSEVIGDKPEAPIVADIEPEEIMITEGEDEPGESLEDLDGDYEKSPEPVSMGKKAPGNLMPRTPWKKILLFGGIPLLALLVVAYIYLPRAKATIFMKAESKQVNIDVVGEKDANLDTEKALVPTQVIEVEKEGSKKFSATGTKDAGTKATGTVFISSAVNDIDWPVYSQKNGKVVDYSNLTVKVE
jgi:hypothetical protein